MHYAAGPRSATEPPGHMMSLERAAIINLDGMVI
jgi:hypothetical protein